ncbi:MAG: MBL fold metallo-hydrolase [Gemmatimonadaceae bacterium]|jgi:metallo-beta-lactamase family protein|nr:MBL fold metallo-hydrolase [Gemmatimonadaceae bacterium]
MHLSFEGAAREVTGSCHLLTVGAHTVALDCGLFQGRREESRAKNERLPIAPTALSAVVLSHAHIDHAGRLPFLVARGYRGPIYATPATRDLCALMLADSARIQESDAAYLERKGRPHAPPLYTTADVTQTIAQMIGVPYGRWFDVCPGIRARYHDAGHILGSASVVLECAEGDARRTLVFSGDIGRSGLDIIRDPDPPRVAADVVLCESTYGNRDHASVSGAKAQLGETVRRTAERGGKVLIPAFAVGRTQELVYDLHGLLDRKQIPAVPVFIDSPLATNATAIFELHPDCWDRGEALVRTDADHLLRAPFVTYTRDVADSKALNSRRGPAVIIAASGMCESGRILHHLLHGASDTKNTILIVGFQAEHTLGRRIVEQRPQVRIFGEEVSLLADVEVLNGYSAHGDRGELRRWLDAVRADGSPAPRVHLVHGEPEAQDAFAAALAADGYAVDAPPRGDTRTL